MVESNFVELLALTFDIIGKILIAITAILVHKKVVARKRIDKTIIREFHREEVYAVLGIVAMLLGYVLHVINLS